MPTQIEALLSERKKQLGNRKLVFKRGRRLLYPSAIERAYEREILRRARAAIRITRDMIIPQLPRIVDQIQSLRPQNDSSDVKMDFGDDLKELVEASTRTLEQEFPEQVSTRAAQNAAVSTSDFHKAQFQKMIASIAGVNVFLDEPYLAQEMNAFIGSNVSLIKTIDNRHFDTVQETIFRGARQGLRHEQIAKMVRSRYRITRNNARRIARDQINKFNGQLNMLRQQNIGVRQYTWQDSDDSRVRPEHRARDGDVFNWDNPPYDGHPGEPVQCRCWARPVLDNLI